MEYKATDWHPADIKCALNKAGWTFARIGRTYGYTRGPADVLRYRWVMMERIVAEILGVHPMEIWPSRYDRLGLPIGPRARLRAIENGGLIPIDRPR